MLRSCKVITAVKNIKKWGDSMKPEYKKYLNEEIESVGFFLGMAPYIFICCNDENVKKYFIEKFGGSK